MADTVKIFLVDDHAVVRNGLRSLIEKMGNFQVTAQYDNGQELIDAMPFADQPHIIIMDLAMPVMDGRQTMVALKDMKSTIPVLMLTLETAENVIIELFRLGIRGYLPKSCSSGVLKKAIEDVVNTGYYHNEMLIKALTTTDIKEADDEKNKVLSHATDRELEFLRLVCDEDELTYEQIADKMGISRRTVDGYRESLFEKFNIKSKTGLVLFAIKYGVIRVDVA